MLLVTARSESRIAQRKHATEDRQQRRVGHKTHAVPGVLRRSDLGDAVAERLAGDSSEARKTVCVAQGGVVSES